LLRSPLFTLKRMMSLVIGSIAAPAQGAVEYVVKVDYIDTTATGRVVFRQSNGTLIYKTFGGGNTGAYVTLTSAADSSIHICNGFGGGTRETGRLGLSISISRTPAPQ